MKEKCSKYALHNLFDFVAVWTEVRILYWRRRNPDGTLSDGCRCWAACVVQHKHVMFRCSRHAPALANERFGGRAPLLVSEEWLSFAVKHSRHTWLSEYVTCTWIKGSINSLWHQPVTSNTSERIFSCLCCAISWLASTGEQLLRCANRLSQCTHQRGNREQSHAWYNSENFQ
jgi:hypothetical protein